MQKEQIIAKLKHKRMGVRLRALKSLKSELLEVSVSEENCDSINYVFRTVYSCFDRTASLAVYSTQKFGMPLTAVVDYASLSSAKELIKAEKITGGIFYCGAEVAVKDADGKRVVLSAVGVPHQNLKNFNDDLASYRSKRLAFSNALREKLNARFKKYSITLPYAFWSLFGAIKTTSTEDLYISLASKIIEKFNSASDIVKFLTEELNVEVPESEKIKLEDISSPHFVFDLAFILHNGFKVKHPKEDLHPAEDFVSLCHKYGAISSATYKGGDLNEFITFIKDLKINSATAEFNANDQEFMQRFYDICIENDILPIIRILVDHPRKALDNKFQNPELGAKYQDTTLAIVGHEISASINPADGMFSPSTVAKFPTIKERIDLFSRIK